MNRANLLQLLAQSRSENNRLRGCLRGLGLLSVSHSDRIINRAIDDAGTLIVWGSVGFVVSRNMALAAGMSERRYYWALALMRAARVASRSRGFRLEVHDVAVAKSMVAAKAAALRAVPDVMAQLRLYHPR